MYKSQVIVSQMNPYWSSVVATVFLEKISNIGLKRSAGKLLFGSDMDGIVAISSEVDLALEFVERTEEPSA